MKKGLFNMKNIWALFSIVLSLSVYAEKKMYFVHNDHLGTPQMLTDKDQNVVWKVESQTPFGEVVVNEDPDGDGNLVEFNLRFPGQYYDGETNTNYNWHRTYDPALGRYLQSDPLGLVDGPNTYSYVHNNPIRFSDPTGQQTVREDLMVGFCVLYPHLCPIPRDYPAQCEAPDDFGSSGVPVYPEGLRSESDDEVDCDLIRLDCAQQVQASEGWFNAGSETNRLIRECIEAVAPQCV